jgi:hypothetical protein
MRSWFMKVAGVMEAGLYLESPQSPADIQGQPQPPLLALCFIVDSLPEVIAGSPEASRGLYGIEFEWHEGICHESMPLPHTWCWCNADT